MARSLAGFVAKRGRSVTLRTYAQSGTDIDYDEPTWSSTDTTIKAVRDIPRMGQVFRSAAGDEVAVDGVFHVADGDEPTLDAEVKAPQVIDEQTFEVLEVEPARLGVQTLNCKKAV